MTEAEFLAQLAECDFSQPAVSRLVTSTYTNVLFDQKVLEYQTSMPLGAQNFFTGFFGTEVFADGQGNDIIREYATDPYIPFTFSHFVRQVQACDPSLANGCDMDLCPVPEGGRGTLPGIQWYTWGFETPRTCIANIRHIRAFQYWASKVIRNRALIDEKVMYMFYVMAALKTAGHKITMNGVADVNGGLTPIPSTDPRNPAPWGSYNYMQDWFPQVLDPQKVMPITMGYLEELARRFELFPQGTPKVGTNSRGGDIFEMWYGDDFYQENVLYNADYMKSLRYTMPNSLFAGYSLKPGEAEIIGNWKFRVMPQLPRFAPTLDGEIIPVDTHVEVPIEVGTEPLPSFEFQNAPYGVALITTGRQATIMTRPTLSKSAEGFPIKPIASNEPWQINNAWHPECNKFENKPFSYRRYNMGFRLDDPNAGTAILHRRRKFAMAPIADCDLAPVVMKEKYNNECPVTTIGCSDGKRRESDNITQNANTPTYVECSGEECAGSGDTALLRIKVARKANQPDFNSLGCDCGDAVTLFIHGDEGQSLRQIQGVVKSLFSGFPYGVYMIEIADSLAAGECVKGIICSDETPYQANVITSFDNTTPGYEDLPAQRLGVLLDGPIGCDDVGDDVQIRYYNAAGLVVGGPISAEIAEIDVQTGFCLLSGVSGNMKALPHPTYTTAVTIGVSCAQAPEASSSSSGT